MTGFRVIVIGAGIAGASTAFALARRGAQVTIVDAAADGQATAASAGIISPWASSADGAFYDLYARSAAHYPVVLDLLAEAGVTHTDYRRSGALYVSADPAALDAAERTVRGRASTYPDAVGAVDRVDSREVRALFPPAAEGLAGLFVSGGGRVDGRTMRDALLMGVGHHGGAVLRGRVDLERSGGRVVVVVDGERAEADAVVVAAGAWTTELLQPFGIVLGLAPQRGQITHLRVARVDTGRWPSVHPLSHHYIVAFDDARVAVGATRETGSGFDTRVTAGGLQQVLADALAIAPGLADATVIETRVGLRPLSSDGLPFVGEVPGVPGLFASTGFGAAGLTMGPFVGEALAATILGEKPPADLAPFAVDRAR
jgi:D-amino-acid dehydrogenase